MKYLLYCYEGFIKTYPLGKKSITLGRSKGNDLCLKDLLVSRFHAQITLNRDDTLTIEDLGSTNGILTEKGLVSRGKLRFNDSFIIGNTEFYYKRGNIHEIKYQEELEPIINNLKDLDSRDSFKIKTYNLQNIYDEILKHFMKRCFKKNNFSEVISELISILSNLSAMGNFYLVSLEDQRVTVHLSIENNRKCSRVYEEIIKKKSALKIGSGNHFRMIESAAYYIYPAMPGEKPSFLIFIPVKRHGTVDNRIHKFLLALSKEIELFSNFFRENDSPAASPSSSPPPPDPYPSIITINPGMKRLILQAQKMAKSDLFILISGESGTGKELFARMIHQFSRRKNSPLVAINCAAIPHDLLESEFFGHEKGSFTGADKQKKGKLEIASGGTLVLDEIGDMPLDLQPKLLRAIQENEFYRVGGITPIKVNLRIICLTNQDLKAQIRVKKFREDLYFRLVHRVITLPTLRERQEDIPILADYFAHKYLQKENHSFRGFSPIAMEAFRQYPWKGNIRELENEIRSIVNLIDPGDEVALDMLSEDIRQYYLVLQKQQTRPLSDSNFATQPRVVAPDDLSSGGDRLIMGFLRRDEKSEKEVILRLLKKNQWNKSQTARDLNITYQGLHKKMKKLNIKKPAS